MKALYDFAAARHYYNRFPVNYSRICAVDTETTGLHLRHGAKGFMLSATWSCGESKLWTARVDPYTRQPRWTANQLIELARLVSHSDWLYVASNKKFDARVIEGILHSIPTDSVDNLPIAECLAFNAEEFITRCHETIGMHHALNNLDSHALKDAALKHAGILDSDESDLHRATRGYRSLGLSYGWALASPTTCHVRKAPKKGWAVMDMWVPREMAYFTWERTEAYEFLQASNFYSSVSPFERQNLLLAASKLDGWQWHSPETSTIDLHSDYTLCGEYCRMDTLRSVTLYQVFEEQLKKIGLLDQYLENGINVLMTYRMENRGVSFNSRFASEEKLGYIDEREAAALAVTCSVSPVIPVNPKAADQLRTIIYSHFQCPVGRLTVNKKNRDLPGKPTVDKDFLADLIRVSKPEDVDGLEPPRFYKGVTKFADHLKALRAWHKKLKLSPADSLFAFCCSVLQYKKANGFITQIENFLYNELGVEEESGFGRLYPSINPFGTKTVRQSCANPNAMNISKGGKTKQILKFMFKTDRTLRSLFGPSPGREWWKCDFSQIQLVIFAVMSGDSKLLFAIENGLDLHDNMARIIFGYPTDPNHPDYNSVRITSNERVIAKGANFGFTFGAQEEKLQQITGLSGLYERLLNLLPGVQTFLEKQEWQVRRHGYVFTQGGYRLYVPETTPYAGSVYAIQGTEAEAVKRATYGIEHYLEQRKSGSQFYLTLPVHDELIFDSDVGRGIEYIGAICNIMADATMSYDLPVKVTPELCSTSWADSVEYELED